MINKLKRTGRVSVYIKWCEDFHAKLRPSYDSAPDAYGELTNDQLRTLVRRVHKYLFECAEKNGRR